MLNFFEEIQSYLKNWEFQYFLVALLNQKASHNIVEELIKHISYMYNVEFPYAFSEYSFYISGLDSIISENLRLSLYKTFITV